MISSNTPAKGIETRLQRYSTRGFNDSNFFIPLKKTYAMQLKILIVIGFMLAAAPGVKGQNMVRISTREGLSNSSILSVAQDADGYIWAGSCEGLNLWDGKQIRNYKLSGNLIHAIIPTRDGMLWVHTNYGFDRFDPREKSCELHARFNRPYAVTARSRDEAFLIHDRGLYGYNPATSEFERVEIRGSSVSLDRGTSLCLDRRGMLWIVRPEGLYGFGVTRSAAGCTVHEEAFVPVDGIAFSRSLDGILLFFDHEHRFYRFEPETGAPALVFDLKDFAPFSNDSPVAIARDRNDYLIAMHKNGLWRLSPTAPAAGAEELGKGAAGGKRLPDREGLAGVERSPKGKGQARKGQPEEKEHRNGKGQPEEKRPSDAANGCGYTAQRIPVEGSIFSLLKDRNQDIVWIGTDGNGLLRQYNAGVRINSVVYDQLPYPLSKPIKALYVDERNDLWIGTKNDGILRIRDFYRCTAYTRQNTVSYTTANSALRHDAVYAFARSRRPLLWIATDDGICYWSYPARRIVPLTARRQLRNVHALYEDAEGTLWAATVGNGVYRIRLTGDGAAPRIGELRALELGENARSRNFFFSIEETADGLLWFCNHGVGAYRYDRKTDRFEEVVFDARRGLPVNDVTAMAVCSDSTYWFGTGYGVVAYDNANGVEKPTPRYGNEQLRTGVIHGIVADTLDNLWVATNAGIVRYTPQTNRSVSYDSSYGLEVVEFSDGASFYDRRAGRLLFGGNNGFVVVSGAQQPGAGGQYIGARDSVDGVHRSDQQPGTGGLSPAGASGAGARRFLTGARAAADSAFYRPPILFRSILIGGREQNLNGRIRDGRLTLPHSQASFALSLIALDYIDGGNYSYLYNLGDDEQKWVDNGRNTQLIFVNLRPGTHTLRVRYRNDTTSELSPVSTLRIRIRPPLYASAWAVAFYLLAAAGCTLLAVRQLRVRHKAREQRKRTIYEQQYHEILYESRINTFTNLTTDLALPLTLINGPCQQILAHRNTDGVVRQWVELIRANASKINDLVYLIHSLAEDLGDACTDRIEWVDVSLLAENISQTFTDRAKTAEVEYRTAIAPNLLFPSIPNLLTTIINLMMTNAFYRSESIRRGSVSLSVSSRDDRLRLAVRAEGRKLDREQLFLISDLHRFLDYLGSDRHLRPIKNDMELAICHNLVAKLHGEFDLEDDGASLVVTLPRLTLSQVMPAPAPAPEEPAARPADAAEDAPLLQLDLLLPPMLLISEDRDMERFIASLFRDEYDVHLYRDPASLDEATWRIVLCNPTLLNDGMLEIIRTIRQTKRFKMVPVILLTATPHPELKLMESGLDVDLCLPLPFNIAHLRDAVNRQMRRYASFRDIDVYGSFDRVQGRILHEEDRAFLNGMLEIIQQNIFKPELSTQYIAQQMGMSKTTFYNRIGSLTSRSPATVIKELRLGYAERLLVQTKLSIDEIIYKSGFVNRSTFFRNFTARYGCTPKVYREQKISELTQPAAKAAE